MAQGDLTGYEIQIGIMPVVLGAGLRLFDPTTAEKLELEKVRAIESAGGRTDILFRVVKEAGK